MSNQNRVTNPAAVHDRRARIFLRMQEGWPYEAIAAEEDLTRERVRQIVRESLEEREADPERDHKRLQAARLDPALRLAAEKVAAGDLKAIDRLIRVLNQLDKYNKTAPGGFFNRDEDEEDAREAILRKLSEVDARRAAFKEWAPPELQGYVHPARNPTAD
jgi:hypothetical protein